MKKLKINTDNSLLKEISLLRDLDHPNVIKFYTSFIDGDHIYLILELAPKGDLLKLITKQKAE